MLTPLEILEGNAKIAEFLGFQTTEVGYYDAEEVVPNEEDNTFDILHFHERLDWLIPAMDKIENLGYKFSIHSGYVDILNDKNETLITSDEGEWAEMVFSAIVLLLPSLRPKELTVEQCVKLLKVFKRDAEMALSGEWDKSDEGFEEQIISINAFLYGTQYEE